MLAIANPPRVEDLLKFIEDFGSNFAPTPVEIARYRTRARDLLRSWGDIAVSDRLEEFGEMVASAVYEIRYQHADDGRSYVHEFESPDFVKIVRLDNQRALLFGDGMDIFSKFPVED